MPWLLPCATVVAQTAVAPQQVALEHFVQRGTSAAAALHVHRNDMLRLCTRGVGEAFGGATPPREVLMQWMQAVPVAAVGAEDLPFWVRVGTDDLPVVCTNVRDRDGRPVAPPVVVRWFGPLRLAVLAVVARPVPDGFVVEDPATAITAALANATERGDAAILVVDGDLATARRLLEGCPRLQGAIATGDRRVAPKLHAVGERFLVQSPVGGTALGDLALVWNGTDLRATGHRFAAASLDAWGQTAAARTATPLREEVPAEDDRDVEPQGLAGHGIEAGAVTAAIDRGVAFLARELAADREGARFGHVHDHVLLALALVHAGWHRRDTAFDAAVREFLREREPSTLGTYSAGLFCLLVEAYGEPEFFGRMRAVARYLVEGQSASGSWTYDPKVDAALCSDPDRRVLQVTGGTPLQGETQRAAEWRRETPWTAHAPGDNSLTQFALLGLAAAVRHGVPVPRETFVRADAWLRRGQRQTGAFGYADRGSDGYGSMTLAGIGSLAITGFHLGDAEFARDEGVRKGLAWLRAHFAIDHNPEAGSHPHYYLYSLERTGRFLDREVLAGQEWYPLGVRHLLATQGADGSWNGQAAGEPPRLATSFALLFLTRATHRLRTELRRGGTGTLRTFARAAPGARVEVVLDASGSMLERIGDRTKFDVARDAVTEVLRGLPPGTAFALRVYGHRKRAIEAGADQDTELLLPLGPFDAAALAGVLPRLRARGRTPLALSLRHAAEELRTGAGDASTTVVLLTDGGEDTRQDPVAAATELGRLPNLRLHVVGFDIEREDWRRQLLAVAAAAHGVYWPANRQNLVAGLRAALTQAPDGFVLLDERGGQVATGRFGDELSLPEGRYRLETRYGERPFAAEVWINTGATTAVVFDGSLAVDG